VMTARAVVEAYDFSGINRIVDVGGGHGTLLSAVLAALPEATGVLYDLPEVIEGADANLKASGQFKRIEKVAGSFFDGVPDNADAYIMKHIIHDWDDERCLQLLRNCHAAMPAHAKLLVCEKVLSEDNRSVYTRIQDLVMLLNTPGGRERTEAEFGALFQKAGFRLTRAISTKVDNWILEVQKA